MSLISTLQETPTKELIRALNSDKGYLYFNISVFNVGAKIEIKCTNTFKQDNPKSWNGCNFIVENCRTTKYYIHSVLKERIEAGGYVFTDRQKKIIENFKN